ncbi:MAG: methyltransferase domain-containing protein [Methanomassiliicoccales archaeon]|nr:methyltransferase domain-containing protein [Methanomassiliicoccales archaeon]NYT15735.1 methyltransferase domain-containing protein [Methanomassiliicoccales archaeon]
MNRSPELKVGFGMINEIILQPIRSILLRTSLEIGVFDVLSDFTSSIDVSKRLGTHHDNTRYLLDGLASCDLVEKNNQMYRNTEMSRLYLVSESANYMGSYIQLYQRSLIDALDDLTEMVQKGSIPSPPKVVDGSYDEFEEYVKALASAAKGGTARIAARIVSQQPEFPTMRRMLDIGGGPGIIAMAIVDPHPFMKGVIFEQPAMAEVARKNISDFGMEDRMEVISGNFLTDPLEESFDLIWTSFCLYFAKHHLDETIKKIFEALEPGGIFISLHEGLNEEGTKPEILVLPNIAMNMNGHDTAFESGEIVEAMRRSGFSDVRSRPEDSPFGEVEVVIGKKE